MDTGREGEWDWLFFNGLPIVYIGAEASLPAASPEIPWAVIGAPTPMRAQELLASGRQIFVLLEPQDLFRERAYLQGHGWTLVYLFSSVPKDFEILKIRELMATSADNILASFQAVHPFSAQSIFHSVPPWMLAKFSVFSFLAEPLSADHLSFREFLENDAPNLRRLCEQGGADYLFLTLPRACRFPKGQLSNRAVKETSFNTRKVFANTGVQGCYEALISKVKWQGMVPKDKRDLEKSLSQWCELESVAHVRLLSDQQVFSGSHIFKLIRTEILNPHLNLKMRGPISRIPFGSIVVLLAEQVWNALKWRTKALFLRIIWWIWGPILRLWGQVSWRPPVWVRRGAGGMKKLIVGLSVRLQRVSGAIRRVWGGIYWKPLVAVKRAWGKFYWKPLVALRGAWGRFWWRPRMVVGNFIGRVSWIWGRLWWRPIVYSHRLWGLCQRVLWRLSFPLRKVYYFIEYQYRKRTKDAMRIDG